MEKDGWTDKTVRTPEKEPREAPYTPTLVCASPPPLHPEGLDTGAEDEDRRESELPEERDKENEDKEKEETKNKRQRNRRKL